MYDVCVDFVKESEKNWKILGKKIKELILWREREGVGFVKSGGIKSLGGKIDLIKSGERMKHHCKTRK